MPDHQKISVTAWLLARARSHYSEIPFAAEIDENISDEMKPPLQNIVFKIVQFIARYKPEKIIPMTVAEGRYLSLDDALPKKEKFVLIELASGLSPRSINMALAGTTVIESDLPWLINFKEKILKKIYKNKNIPSHHRLMTTNALNREELDALGKVYLKLGKNLPVYLVHEGMANYFTDNEKKQLRDNIAYFLNTYARKGGYWITSDFSPFPEKNKQSSIFNFVKKIIEKDTDRKITFFSSHEETQKFLEAGDLVGAPVPNEHILRQMKCLKKINLSYQDLKKGAPLYTVYKIETKEQALKKAKHQKSHSKKETPSLALL